MNFELWTLETRVVAVAMKQYSVVLALAQISMCQSFDSAVLVISPRIDSLRST
jgi:hypothetical protein